MGKNKKQRNGEQARARRQAPKKGGNGWVIGLLGLLVVAMGGYSFWGQASSSGSKHRYIAPGGEQRPMLDPALFTGVVARGYQIAREIPQVLDKLYCWCQCVEGHGHKSNLSCFAESHAAG